MHLFRLDDTRRGIHVRIAAAVGITRFSKNAVGGGETHRIPAARRAERPRVKRLSNSQEKSRKNRGNISKQSEDRSSRSHTSLVDYSTWLFWWFEVLDVFYYSYVAIWLVELWEMFDGFVYWCVAAGLFWCFKCLDGFDSQDQSGGTCTTDGSACGSRPLSTAVPCSCHKQNIQNKTKTNRPERKGSQLKKPWYL